MLSTLIVAVLLILGTATALPQQCAGNDFAIAQEGTPFFVLSADSCGISIGYDAVAAPNNSVAIGCYSSAAHGSVAKGVNAAAGGEHSVALGASASVGNGSDWSVAIGGWADVQDGAQSAVAIGYNSDVADDNSVAIGAGAAAGNSTVRTTIGAHPSVSGGGGASFAVGSGTAPGDQENSLLVDAAGDLHIRGSNVFVGCTDDLCSDGVALECICPNVTLNTTKRMDEDYSLEPSFISLYDEVNNLKAEMAELKRTLMLLTEKKED